MTVAPAATVLRTRLLLRARLRHLQVLVKVAELGSLKRAAESVGLTQPAVTHMIADLESLLECSLFQRHSRGVRPTPIGMLLQPLAQRMLDAMQECAEEVAAMSGGASEVVRVAAIMGATRGLLARAIPRFATRYPDILLHVLEIDAAQIGTLISRGDVDAVLCHEPQALAQGWLFEPLMSDRFVVVARPGHPLAKRRRLSLEALTKERWLGQPVGTAARRAFDDLMSDAEFQPPMRRISTRAPALLWAMLQHERLLAIVPESIVRQLIDAGQLVVIDLDRTLPFAPIGIMVPVENLGAAAHKLHRFLREFSRQEQ